MERRPPIFSDRLRAQETRRKRIRRLCTVVGVMAISAWGAGHLDKSGTLREYGPQTEVRPVIDDNLVVASWNMHNETADKIKALRKLIKVEGPDVVALQEVNSEDAKELHEEFSSWHIEYALADSRQEFQDGGYGNLLMTRQIPKDVKIKPIDGTSPVQTAKGIITGTIKDTPGFVTHIMGEDKAEACQQNTQQSSEVESTILCGEKQPVFKDAIAGWQEQRAAEAITIKTQVDNKLQDARIITGHISGNHSVHDKQLQEWMGFIKDNTKEGRITVVCGDFNSPPEKIIQRAAKELGYYIPVTDSTSSTNEATIDYCGFYTGGLEGIGNTKVIKKQKTDHHPIIGSLVLTNDE